MIQWKLNTNTGAFITFDEETESWKTGTPTKGDLIYVTDDFTYIYTATNKTQEEIDCAEPEKCWEDEIDIPQVVYCSATTMEAYNKALEEYIKVMGLDYEG